MPEIPGNDPAGVQSNVLANSLADPVMGSATSAQPCISAWVARWCGSRQSLSLSMSSPVQLPPDVFPQGPRPAGEVDELVVGVGELVDAAHAGEVS